MFLQEAVQICQRTEKRFRRPTWAETVSVAVVEMGLQSTGDGGHQLTDLVLVGETLPPDGVSYNADSEDILANDYEIIG